MGHQDAAVQPQGSPVPLLPVRTRGGDASSSAPSEPPSPALHDGCTLLLDGASQPGSSCSEGDCGSGGAACWLAQGASEQEQAENKRVQRKLVIALCLAFAFMLVEVAGGIYAHSLAIITDAAHLLSDVSGFAVALVAAVWAKRRARERYSFGYHRVEVLGALVSVMMVWVITLNLLLEAVRRLVEPEPVNGKVMFIVAMIGVGCNVLMMAVLGHHHHGHACSHSHSHGHSGCGGHAHAAKAPDAAAACGSGACCGGQHKRRHVYAAIDLEAGAGDVIPSAGHGSSKQGARQGEELGETTVNPVCSALMPILAAAGFSEPGSSSDDPAHTHPSPRPPLRLSPRLPAALSRGGGGAAPAAAAAAAKCGHEHAGGEGCGTHGHSHSHSHSHGHNMNVRGAIIHVIGDFVQSIGVAIAGALIWWQDDPRWHIADPICTFLFAVLVLWTTKQITADIFGVLMERAPPGLDVGALRRGMAQVPGVEAVRDLHVWSLTPGIPLLTAHVALAPGADAGATLERLEAHCRAAGVQHCTIQPVGGYSV